jgi:hypothetical protein
MNILLWVLQVILALHTAAGAAFKFSHSPEQTMASLKAIPQGVWSAMIVVELLCCVSLVVPAFGKRLGVLVPLAAAYIVAEMLFFSALQVSSGPATYGPMIYWLVVAGVSAFIAYGRLKLKPIAKG